jgi:Tol biopolymer transport system component/predicted Ser/Thr protein kinase
MISSGSRLGPYEVVSPLGAGGMGEVFKARDTRLDRSVAIKILPAEFATNAQLRLRFEREAKTISQLNHPNICTLYDVGENYLVMELLEGETLAERIAKGPLPVEQVLRYGMEIAEALERAHKAGIVHRDLKPSNVMLTKSGAKLLDFGLAKESDAPSLNALTGLRTEQKPLTEEGTLVGTFQYMAPEQLEGGPVDARTDIFAFGALLYEMATGKRAFEGKSKASLIASILTSEPRPIGMLQPASPAELDRLIRICLRKDPDERWQSAHDVALELRGVSEVAEKRPHAGRRNALAWTVAALFALATIVLAMTLFRRPTAQRAEMPVRTLIVPPDKTEFDFLNAAAPPAVSADGKRIVFGAAEKGKVRTLWIRSLDSLSAQQLAGTERATYPFWSPDGRTIAFFLHTALKKIEITGGAPVTVCNVIDARGGSWSPDGRTIIFAGRFAPISRVPAGGGTPVEVTKTDDQFTTHRWPEFLPDGKHFLFLGSPTGGEDSHNAICAGNIEGGPIKVLINNAGEPHYVAGAIVFARDRILTAQRFDMKTLSVSGDAIPLSEQQVETTSLFSRSVVTTSADGTLAYQTGAALENTQLTWFDRAGKVTGHVGEDAPYGIFSLSPDGKAVAVSYGTRPQANIWVIDFARGVRTRMSFGTGAETAPIWSPDGRRLIFTSVNDNLFSLTLKDLTTGAEQRLLTEEHRAYGPSATSWSQDGERILYTMHGNATQADIWSMSLADGKRVPYLKTSFIESVARFSPDGKWVAYQSNESGPFEVYVAPFPPTGAKWQVSANGGTVPRWRSDMKELFYYDALGSRVMAVPIALGPTPQIGQAAPLFHFETAFSTIGQLPTNGLYDVTRDGQRFLANTRIGETPLPAPLILVQHFDAELRAALERRE